jgi:hypothetical protein
LSAGEFQNEHQVLKFTTRCRGNGVSCDHLAKTQASSFE